MATSWCGAGRRGCLSRRRAAADGDHAARPPAHQPDVSQGDVIFASPMWEKAARAPFHRRYRSGLRLCCRGARHEHDQMPADRPRAPTVRHLSRRPATGADAGVDHLRIYLPKLAAQVGIAPGAVILILMLDQLIFTVTDTAMGIAADRIAPLSAGSACSSDRSPRFPAPPLSRCRSSPAGGPRAQSSSSR